MNADTYVSIAGLLDELCDHFDDELERQQNVLVGLLTADAIVRTE